MVQVMSREKGTSIDRKLEGHNRGYVQQKTERMLGGVTNVPRILRISRVCREVYICRQTRQKKMWQKMEIDICLLSNIF
jgi:hypothetical protein